MPSHETAGDLGEFALIDRIAAILGEGRAEVGIGDDAAVLDLSGQNYLLATTDSVVEGIHFQAGATDPETIGRRALATNVSDIAAMGGSPAYALTSLALPPSTHISFIDSLYRGIKREADAFGVEVVGGNVTRTSGPLVVDITLLGQVARDEVILRRGARVGDVLAVTGTLGQSAATRLASTRGVPLGAREGFDAPLPRLEQGRALAQGHLVHAMLDLSDGLSSDLHHLAQASGVGAVLYEENLPISLAARQAADALGTLATDLALGGGEDYELLMALAEEDVPRAQNLCGRVSLTVVGTVLHSDQGVMLERFGGRREVLPATGWTHF